MTSPIAFELTDSIAIYCLIDLNRQLTLHDWEKIKIGARTPRVPCKYGRRLVYNGVDQTLPVGDEPHHLGHSA